VSALTTDFPYRQPAVQTDDITLRRSVRHEVVIRYLLGWIWNPDQVLRVARTVFYGSRRLTGCPEHSGLLPEV